MTRAGRNQPRLDREAAPAGRRRSHVAAPLERYRFYGELAEWWPLISPVEEYADEAAFASTLLRSASRPVHEVLELGSGGGHNAFYLKGAFSMTLVDLSDEMLAVSRQLNPECEHHRGDMRTFRLGGAVDAVFVHDAVDYMTTEADLAMAMTTAFVHCRPGGIAIFLPDVTAEAFEPSSDIGGTDGADGRGARLMEWTWDPNTRDSWAQTEYAFLLRDRDGAVRMVHETHRTGLFAKSIWLRELTNAGFRPEATKELTTENRRPRDVFVGHRPFD